MPRKSFLRTPVSPITLDENPGVQKLVEDMGKTIPNTVVSI